MPAKSNPDVKLTIAQATSDTRHGIVKIIRRMAAKNKRDNVMFAYRIDSADLIAKILEMDERAKLKPGGEGQRRVSTKMKK